MENQETRAVRTGGSGAALRRGSAGGRLAHRIGLALLVSVAWVPTARGQEPSTPEAPGVRLDAKATGPDAAGRLVAALDDAGVRALVEDALEHNPAIAAAVAHARSAREKAPQADALPDPTLGVTAYVAPPETRVGPQRFMATLSQRFPWFGTVEAREQAALRQAEAFDASVQAQRLALVTDVRRLCYETAFLDVYRREVEADRRILAHFEELARARYASGAGIEQGVVKIQAEITKADNRLLDIATRKAALVASLNALRDHPADAPLPPLALPETTPGAAPPIEALRTRALAERPELAGVEAEIRRSDALVALAGKEYKPDVTLGVTYTAVGRRTDPAGMLQPPPDNGSDIFGISASVNLPIKRGRLKAGVQEAADLRLAAVERRRDVTSRIDQALGELGERLRLSGEQVRLFDRVLVLQAEQSLRSVEAGYSAGGLGSLDLLDAERTLLEVRTGAARARADHAIALARLEGAIGGPLTRETPGAEQ
jgi:cobalt-zinc-cadmium efflux system outer membrane protein